MTIHSSVAKPPQDAAVAENFILRAGHMRAHPINFVCDLRQDQ